MTGLPAIAVTQGDPSGIGPDITLDAWLRRGPGTPTFAVFGDPAIYAARAKLLRHPVRVVEADLGAAPDIFWDALPVVPTAAGTAGIPGRPDPRDAAGTIAAIQSAVSAVHGGAALAVVTNPIAKHVLYNAGFKHPGHTEYLGELAALHWGGAPRPVMMLWSDALAVVPVTIHVALAQVPRLLTAELIMHTARVVHAELRTRFGIAAPRLVCAGLNPHAGENGTMGREEIELIAPALDRLRAKGLAIAGPLSADTMFHAEARAGYDAALTMYHDQGLIPIKTLSFDTGVNVTLGLPLVRTSPDHGTAFALAGRGTANPASLIAALNLAARLAKAGPGVARP